MAACALAPLSPCAYVDIIKNASKAISEAPPKLNFYFEAVAGRRKAVFPFRPLQRFAQGGVIVRIMRDHIHGISVRDPAAKEFLFHSLVVGKPHMSGLTARLVKKEGTVERDEIDGRAARLHVGFEKIERLREAVPYR